MTDLLKTISTEQVVFDRLRVGCSTRVGRDAILHVQPEDIMGDLLVRLESSVLAERILTEPVIGTGVTKFPASPWQFFKQRHAEAWWLRWLVERRPVVTQRRYVKTYAELTAHRTYPEATIRVPELGRPVIWETVTWT